MTAAARHAVLHVAFPAHGGVARVVRDLVDAQLDAGWAVTVASPRGPLTRWLDPRAVHVPWEATRAPGPTIVAETLRLRRIIGHARPDLVHLHSSKAGLAGRLALRGHLPTVFQPHAWSFLAATGGLASAARTWERAAARWTDVIVHVSAAERRLGDQAGIKPVRWALVPNGVDLAVFQPRDRAEARRRLGLDDNPLAVCIGRICRQKAQDLLVDIWPGIRDCVPTAALALVGRVEEPLPPLPDGVTVREETDDPRDWYAAADLVVTPSRWEAGLPLVAREAMACARAVVVSSLEVVRDDFPAVAGALVPTDDATAWTRALVTRLSNLDGTRKEGESAHRHALAHFDVAQTAAGIASVYEALLDAKAR